MYLTGGLFDLAESKQEVAFRYAVERVNANRKILSQSLLSAIIEKIPPQDSFHASKRGKFWVLIPLANQSFYEVSLGVSICQNSYCGLRIWSLVIETSMQLLV